MKKKTQRTLSRIILGVLSLYVILCFALPFLSHSEEDLPIEDPTTPTQEETFVVETTEPETTTPTVTPTVTKTPLKVVELATIEEPTVMVIESLPEPKTKVLRYSKPFSYTEQELDLLARLVESEGGTESYDTRLKIASVVINRVNDPKFPETIKEVIYAKSQFSVTVIYKNGILMIDYPASEDSIKAARDILENGSVLPQEVQVFYSKSCREPWVTSRETYGTFDNTVFAYIYSRR